MVGSAPAIQEHVSEMAIKGRKFLQELGKRLKELRKAQNLTQAQLAQLLGISQQLVAFYEGGHQRIPIDLLPEVARLLGVRVEELLGLSAGTARRGPTPKFQQQLERINRLPRTKQRFVMEMLDAVLTQAGA